ncbi:UDP-glycosyltransferase 82A1 isoform X2 [Ipomoea triloba]|uniref:UDP-glycosyltransferase 82A1 isoform X2 n=1 Tax=Ipomoea triloba TaxID=35885 RepID=UPI00125D075D|nr:UDP-glycosyltransferase 82A1 isoform X2 [Ipomoea triloba]
MKYRISKGNKVILVPYPAQGHVTPMLKLGSALLSHGFRPVIATPEFIHAKISKKIDANKDGTLCMAIPNDGLDAGKATHDFFAVETAMEEKMPTGFKRLLRREKLIDETACVIVDLLASWAIDVARDLGLKVAGFWPAMLTTYKLIDSIPDMIVAGIISQTGCPLQLERPTCSLPSQPNITTKDLPWLIGNSSSRLSRFKFWTRTMNRSRTLEWILVNTFPAELITSNNNTNGCNDHPTILPVGPLSAHSRIQNNPTFWEEDMSCLDWLNQQATRSVVYVSFGSWVSPIGKDKLMALALALETCKRPFIWVLAASWRDGLPKDYLERVSKHGRIVAWAPQTHVLQHDAVGCYLMHCGWNSTMEAIQFRKPLVCYPVAGDQFVNCAFIVKKWRVGVQIEELGPSDVHEGLRSVMEDDDMSERMKRLNEDMITSAMASSKVMANLTNFISDVTSQCAGQGKP